MKGKKEKRGGREREIWMNGCMGGCMDGCMDKLIPGRQKKMIFLLNIEFYWILADKKKKNSFNFCTLMVSTEGEMKNLYLSKGQCFPSGIRKFSHTYFSMNLRLSCPSDTSVFEMKCSSRTDINCYPSL